MIARETESFLTILGRGVARGQQREGEGRREGRGEKDRPVAPGVESAKVLDVAREVGLEGEESLEDGVAYWDEGIERAVDAAWKVVRNISSVLSVGKRERGVTIEDAVLLHVVRAGLFRIQDRRDRLGASMVLGPAEQPLSSLRSDVWRHPKNQSRIEGFLLEERENSLVGSYSNTRRTP